MESTEKVHKIAEFMRKNDQVAVWLNVDLMDVKEGDRILEKEELERIRNESR